MRRICRQAFLDLPGNPVEYIEHYSVHETSGAAARQQRPADTRPPFADLQSELLSDLMPTSKEYPPGSHPFGARTVRGAPWMMFNLNPYMRLLMSDFLKSGGKIQIVEFHSPADFGPLREKTLVNATGYGARALFGDESVVPVRGQLAHTIPQPGIHFGLLYKDVNFVPRRDGNVYQVIGTSDYYGFDDDSTQPDPAEARRAVTTIGSLFTAPQSS